VSIELFSQAVTAEALRTNTDWKSAFFEWGWSVSAKFSRSRERSQGCIFERIERLYNFVADSTL